MPSSTMPLISAKSIDSKDEQTMARFIEGMAEAFSNVHISIAFMTDIDKTPPPYPSPSINHARTVRHLSPQIIAQAARHAELIQAGDFSALAIWETTSFIHEPLGSGSSSSVAPPGSLKNQWITTVQSSKERYIGVDTDAAGSRHLKPHYSLAFLARNPSRDAVPHAISAVVKPWLKRADMEGVPVWLEATDEHARAVYEHFGFRALEEVVVGSGLVDYNGWPSKGGEGCRLYLMLYGDHTMASARPV